MSDMRAYKVHLAAQSVANEMLVAHARGGAGSYNIMLGLEHFGRLHAAVHALTTARHEDGSQTPPASDGEGFSEGEMPTEPKSLDPES